MFYRVVGALLLVLVFGGCTTGPSAGYGATTLDSDELSNRLLIDGYEIALPVGWTFLQGDSNLNRDVIATFESPSGIVGSIEILPAVEPLDTNRLVDYFAGTVFLSDRRPQTSNLLSATIGPIVLVSGDYHDRTVWSLIAPESPLPAILHLSFPPDNVLSVESAVLILEAVNAAPTGVVARFQPGSIGFVSSGQGWIWLSDYRGGFVVARADPTEGLGAIFWPDPDPEVETDEDLEEVPGFDSYPAIREGAYHVRVFRDEYRAGVARALVVYENDRESYALVVADRTSSDEKNWESILTDPAVQELLDFYLRFPPAGGVR